MGPRTGILALLSLDDREPQLPKETLEFSKRPVVRSGYRMIERFYTLAIEETQKERPLVSKCRPATGECALHLDRIEMN